MKIQLFLTMSTMLNIMSTVLFLCAIKSPTSSAFINYNKGIKKTFFMKPRISVSLSMTDNTYFQDLNILNKYQNYFLKDNYNNIITDVIDHKVSKIFVDNTYKQLVSVDDIPINDMPYTHFHIADINPVIIQNLVQKTAENNIPLYFVNFTPEYITNIQKIAGDIFSLAMYAFSIYFVISIISGIFARGPPTNVNMNMNNFKKNGSSGNNKNPLNIFANLQGDTEEQFVNPNVSLASWAGSPEVVEECKEVISYIENRDKYKIIGAEMPKGILFEGPPGTGKTLLAKAIASETNSTFITMSGSEFVELFVGMGASRVRELFETAREYKPCIIFIDEIDAIGRQRSVGGANMANEEREQTLNQLLYEMDGFNDNDDIVVIAATNRKDILDQALIRPGRFDRIIKIPLPDKQSREKILEFYLNSKNLENPFDISSIAELTDGFSGAELKNLINEAAILSVRNNYTVIQERFVFDSFEKSIVGLIRKNATVAPSTRLRVAIHESGHALLVAKFNQYFDLQKVSIQPTYNGAGGYTLFTEKPEIREGGLYTKDMLKKRLIISMGGKAAESIYYGNDFVSLGAIQDLKQANGLAKRMIGNFGMGNELEVFYNENINDDSILTFTGQNKYSEYTKQIMDKESLNLVKEAYDEAKNILLNNTNLLFKFSQLLQNRTVINIKKQNSK